MCHVCRGVAARQLPIVFAAAAELLNARAAAEAPLASDDAAKQRAVDVQRRNDAIAFVGKLADALNNMTSTDDRDAVVAKLADPLDTLSLNHAARTAYYLSGALHNLASYLNVKIGERAVLGDCDAAKFYITDTGREISLSVQHNKSNPARPAPVPTFVGLIGGAMAEAAGVGVNSGEPSPKYEH